LLLLLRLVARIEDEASLDAGERAILILEIAERVFLYTTYYGPQGIG
jgi:hypothetical protein